MSRNGAVRWWEVALTLTFTLVAALSVFLLLSEEPGWRKFYAGITLMSCIVGMMVVFRDSNRW